MHSILSTRGRGRQCYTESVDTRRLASFFVSRPVFADTANCRLVWYGEQVAPTDKRNRAIAHSVTLCGRSRRCAVIHPMKKGKEEHRSIAGAKRVASVAPSRFPFVKMQAPCGYHTCISSTRAEGQNGRTKKARIRRRGLPRSRSKTRTNTLAAYQTERRPHNPTR